MFFYLCLKRRKQNSKDSIVLFYLCLKRSKQNSKDSIVFFYLYLKRRKQISKDSIVFFYLCLKRRKQNFKMNNSYSAFEISLSGVPQDSILGLALFNNFIKDLLLSKNTLIYIILLTIMQYCLWQIFLKNY